MIRKKLLGAACAAVIFATCGMPAFAAKADMTANVQRNTTGSFEAVMEIPTADNDTTIVTGDDADDEGMYDVAVIGDKEEMTDIQETSTSYETAKEDKTEAVSYTVETKNSTPVAITEEAPAQEKQAAEETVDIKEQAVEENTEAVQPTDTEDAPAAEEEGAEVPAKEAQTENEAPQEEAAPEQSEVVAPEAETQETIQAPVAAPNANIDLPADVQAWCEQAAAEFGLDKNVLEGLVWVESKGNVGARNGSYIGLTQLNPKYFSSAMSVLGITDPAEAVSNLRICAYSLNGWISKYGNTHIALDCWHSGEGAAASKNRTDGTGYTRLIMQKADQYRSA